MVMLRKLGRIDTPMARHSEMEHQGVAAIGVDQSVLRPSAKLRDPRTGQPLPEIDRKSTAEIRSARFHARDPTAT
jgi:hypothetical protein